MISTTRDDLTIVSIPRLLFYKKVAKVKKNTLNEYGRPCGPEKVN